MGAKGTGFYNSYESELDEDLLKKPKKRKWKKGVKPGEKGYEVSTKGDERFSALNAKLKDGRTIEEAYQMDVKGYSSVKEGKGKPPKDTNIDTYAEYKKLWQRWAYENPDLMDELEDIGLHQEIKLPKIATLGT